MRPLFLAPAIFVTSVFFLGCGGEKAPPPPNVPKYPAVATGGPVLYRLPVNGNWRVQRTHYGATNDQAYALDLVLDAPIAFITIRKNEEFPSYNQPVVADAPGVVVTAVDGVPENALGTSNHYDLHGNFVVIDHQNGEYSLFAHFIPGSLKVRVGMTVAAGTELGRCGNSGQYTMPHLHWQVHSSALSRNATGTPPRFSP